MSLHRSLRTAVSSKGHRNVLKRLERIKKLKTEERWSEEKDSIYNLPKVRSIKVRAKAKTKEAVEGEAAAPGAATAPAAAAPAAQPAAKAAPKKSS